MTTDLRIAVTADAQAAVSGLGQVDTALSGVSSAATDAARDMSKVGRDMSGIGDAADGVASSSSQAAGGLGDLGGALSLLPGPLGVLGSGMEAAAPAIMGVTGAADLLNLVTTKFPRLARLATVATNAQAAAQRALNVVMRANPIGLVITALTLLGAGLVLLYNKSTTFRNLCSAAFRAVAEAGRWMWNNVLQPVFSGLLTAIATVLDMWAKMLSALGRVPGFGWAADAAEKLENASGKVRDLRDNLKKIPSNTTARVHSPGLQAAAGWSTTLKNNLLAIPALAGAALGSLGARPVSVNGKAVATSTVPTTTVNITVQGALDPVAVARQIQQLLGRQNIRIGVAQ